MRPKEPAKEKKKLKAVEVLSYGAQVTLRVSGIESVKLYQGEYAELEITMQSGDMIRTTSHGILESHGWTTAETRKAKETEDDKYMEEVKEAEHKIVGLYHDLQEALGFTE